MNWYIVIGRKWGDDEATALKLQAKSPAKAKQQFKKELRGDDKPAKGWARGDGPGTVWTDNVFDCGANEPKEV